MPDTLTLACEQTSRCRARHCARSKSDVANHQTRRVDSWRAQRVMENPQVSASQASAGIDCLQAEAAEQPRCANASHRTKQKQTVEKVQERSRLQSTAHLTVTIPVEKTVNHERRSNCQEERWWQGTSSAVADWSVSSPA